MLVLARKEGETLLIYPSTDIDPCTPIGEVFSQPVEVTIAQIKGSQVRVGIRASKALAVVREELETVYVAATDPKQSFICIYI